MAGGPGWTLGPPTYSETELSRPTYTVLQALVKPRLTVGAARLLAQLGEERTMNNVKHGVWLDTIPGGYRRMSTENLCRIWTLHLSGKLKRLDLRVWFALHEMAERRCTLKRGRTPRFRIEEVVTLLGDVGEAAARASLRRLRTLGVCHAGTSKIRFAHPNGADGAHLSTMLHAMPRKKRWLHVPRRVLRQLASGCSRSETAVMLGAVIRCIFLHRGEGRHRVDGRLPARWVAEAFGVSERAVIGARQRLTALGWLKSLESPGWSVARFGKRVMLALGSAGGWVHPVVGSAWARQTRHFLRKIQQELTRRATKGREGWHGRDSPVGVGQQGVSRRAVVSGSGNTHRSGNWTGTPPGSNPPLFQNLCSRR